MRKQEKGTWGGNFVKKKRLYNDQKNEEENDTSTYGKEVIRSPAATKAGQRRRLVEGRQEIVFFFGEAKIIERKRHLR